ncbi:MAG: phosphate acetyltransferase, partial [Clostridiales bacterium]|nr:phosphate acetyltransferase [Clostridiales bacterium]
MALVDRIKAKARQCVKHIVLPEGDEPRTIQAAAAARTQGIAKLTLLGDPAKIREVAGDTSLDGIDIIDPANSTKAAHYAEKLYELRKAKGMTPEKAAELVKDVMYYGMMMLKLDDADGLVSGAVHATSDMVRPALQILKAKKGLTAVSSCFLIECPNRELGDDGVYVFSDSGLIIDPTVEELAAIAAGAADSARL